ncbi:MAG: hypothetical protein JSS94_04785 [Bacteroidetes bacterium]|nr:hypothetical protein [Bacteroidota bacterium]
MKTHLYIYGVLILLFIAYNIFFKIEDPLLHTIINIVGVSVIFLYIAFMAIVVLKKLKNKK